MHKDGPFGGAERLDLLRERAKAAQAGVAVGPVLAEAQLGNRHDIAIIASEGYATEAIRTLLERAERHCQLFVLHDADADGYNIARTLCEETARMPWYEVDVVDLGLTVGDGLAMGLEAETFTQDKNLPQDLLDKLGKDERAFLQGRPTGTQRNGRTTWTRNRIELNAMTGPQLIAYIERRLAEEGAAGKVLPEDRHLPALAEAAFGQQVAAAVDAAVREMLSLDDLQQQVALAMRAHVDLSQARRMIDDGLAEDDTQSWHAALCTALRRDLDEHTAVLMEEVRARLGGRCAPTNRTASADLRPQAPGFRHRLPA